MLRFVFSTDEYLDGQGADVQPQGILDIDRYLLASWLPMSRTGPSARPERPPVPNYVRGIRNAIGAALVRSFGPEAAPAIPVLYGGSVNLENAADVLAYGAVDEMFVGRTAWQPAGMAALIRSAIRHLTLAEPGNAPTR
jgi:hypothetical protein